jgi:hypothetical protein
MMGAFPNPTTPACVAANCPPWANSDNLLCLALLPLSTFHSLVQLPRLLLSLMEWSTGEIQVFTNTA